MNNRSDHAASSRASLDGLGMRGAAIHSVGWQWIAASLTLLAMTDKATGRRLHESRRIAGTRRRTA